MLMPKQLQDIRDKTELRRASVPKFCKLTKASIHPQDQTLMSCLGLNDGSGPKQVDRTSCPVFGFSTETVEDTTGDNDDSTRSED